MFPQHRDAVAPQRDQYILRTQPAVVYRHNKTFIKAIKEKKRFKYIKDAGRSVNMILWDKK